MLIKVKRPIIGWLEWVGLPDLRIDTIAAKVDTGARSSSIDVSKVEELGDGRIRFVVHLDRGHSVPAEAEIFDVRSVRNPGKGGRDERRFVIQTGLELAGQRWPIEVNLARRTRMQYRMLIGRTAIKNRVLVDPSASYLLGGDPK
jgi:hypothetical protein